MKNQEALKILREMPKMFNGPLQEAITVAEAALEHQIDAETRPTKLAVKELTKMQPQLVKKSTWGVHNCPACGFRFHPYQYKDKYCCKCGQRLEWA